jgi:putative transposase
VIRRNRTSSKDIGYGLYLYFLGLSTRNVANRALSFLNIVKRSHVAVWKWIQKYNPQKILSRRKKIAEFILDETQVKVGSGYIWLWVAIIEPKNCQILALYIYPQREEHAHRRTLSVKHCGGRLWKKYCFNRDGGTWYPPPQACRFLKLKHPIFILLWRRKA